MKEELSIFELSEHVPGIGVSKIGDSDLGMVSSLISKAWRLIVA